MCPDFRRGADAVAKAQQKAKSGGSFSPFAPEIFWAGDGDERYLLFLNPMNDIPTVEMIGFIPQKRKRGDGTTFETFERVIARTDPAIGEENDPMTDDWQGKPRDTCVAVAVELEPTLEEVRGRMRPTGFEIKTNTYERRVRDEEGDLTDETEEVTAPAVGFIHASPHNFFNVVTAYDSKEGDIESTPLKITRVGGDKSTVYQVTGYPDQTVDLSPLLDYIEGVSYFSEDEMDDLIAAIDASEDSDAALIIGEIMLDKRLVELADRERYDKLYAGITKTLDKFGGGKEKKGKGKSASKRERPARQSSRRTRTADSEPEAEAAEAPAEEPKATRTRRTRAKAEPEAETTPQQDPEQIRKLDRLRKRNEEAKAKTTA